MASAGSGRTFEVLYIESADSTSLCTLAIGDQGISVHKSATEEVAILIKWERVEAWWHTDDSLVLSIKGSDGGDSIVYKFKCDTLADLVEAMIASLSCLLRAKQSSILDDERDQQDGTKTRIQRSDSSFSLQFKLQEPLEGVLLKRRNKFPHRWQKRFFAIVAEKGYYSIRYWQSKEDRDAGAVEIGAVDLRTVDKLAYTGDEIEFQAFQPNKERSKEWHLKSESKAKFTMWARVLQEIYNDVKKSGLVSQISW